MITTLGRWKVTLVDRTQYFRRPRTKNRRIRKKWRKRPENWRPMMVPVGKMFCFGSAAGNPNFGPYHNDVEPHKPRILEMHTKLWEKVKSELPEFAARCDLFRQVLVKRDGMDWQEDEPILAP